MSTILAAIDQVGVFDPANHANWSTKNCERGQGATMEIKAQAIPRPLTALNGDRRSSVADFE